MRRRVYTPPGSSFPRQLYDGHRRSGVEPLGRKRQPPLGFGTQANGINIFLEVVGVYTDRMGTFHGMLWAGGEAFSIDYPGAPYSEVHSINAGGNVTGAYIVDLTGENYRGFVAYRKNRQVPPPGPGAAAAKAPKSFWTFSEHRWKSTSALVRRWSTLALAPTPGPRPLTPRPLHASRPGSVRPREAP
jgi:hypothetical protein